MLSDERILKIASSRESLRTNYDEDGYVFDKLRFARAIERESTATLLERIKEDEALMHKALAILDCVASDLNIDIREFPTWLSVIPRLRQRLEAKK